MDKYNFNHKIFLNLSEFIFKHSGINLSNEKKPMLYSRLIKRLHALNLSSFDQYLKILKSGDKAEALECINAITTNLTYFFRIPHQFDFIENDAFPNLLKNKKPGDKVKIWSAGCSLGAEALSLALLIKKHEKEFEGYKAHILATDINVNILKQAQMGIYKNQLMDNIPPEMLEKWFYKGHGDFEGHFKPKEPLLDLISYEYKNLLEPTSGLDSFDIIFCRNVLIFFDEKTKDRILAKLISQMNIGGYLFLGSGETITKPPSYVQSHRNAIYRKVL